MEESPMGADLRIECDGASGSSCTVLLNGQDISRFTSGVDLKLRAGDVTEVTLHVFVDHIDLGVNADVKVNAPLLQRAS